MTESFDNEVREDQEGTMPPAGSWQHHLWLEQRREEYEEAESARRREEERRAKQADLEAFLRRRGEAWRDHVGEVPPRELVSQWTQEYMEARFVGEDPEDERRRERAEHIW